MTPLLGSTVANRTGSAEALPAGGFPTLEIILQQQVQQALRLEQPVQPLASFVEP